MYDVQSSPKRTIQRMGRTGRHSDGKVMYIITRGSGEAKKYDKLKVSRENVKKVVTTDVEYKFAPSPRMVCVAVMMSCPGA